MQFSIESSKTTLVVKITTLESITLLETAKSPGGAWGKSCGVAIGTNVEKTEIVS